MSVDSDNNALNTLANLGMNSPGSVAALQNAGGIQAEASNLGNIVNTPIDFSAQNNIIGQGDQASNALDALSQNLAVQKAVAAQAADKDSRMGKSSTGDRDAQTQADINSVGQTGLQEQHDLQSAALSNRTAMALGRLHITTQQIAQQGLQSTARQAALQTGRDISLAQSGGDQAVFNAAQNAHNNGIALMNQYNAQQWSFWTKIATGLLSAGGAVGGLLLGGPAGAVAGGAIGNAAGSSLGGTSAAPATLNGYQTYSPQVGTSLAQPDSASGSAYTTPVLNTAYTGSSPDTATANASYTQVDDGLPIT